jgi:hypothetical protein
MRQIRLSGFAIISIERYRSIKLETSVVIRNFAESKAGRKNFELKKTCNMIVIMTMPSLRQQHEFSIIPGTFMICKINVSLICKIKYFYSIKVCTFFSILKEGSGPVKKSLTRVRSYLATRLS